METNKTSLARRSGITLISFGILLLLFSWTYNSLTITFIGLTFTLWGILLTFILPQKYVSNELLISVNLPLLLQIDKVIRESDCKGKALYLPQYTKDVYIPFLHLDELKKGLIFLPKQEDTEIGLKEFYREHPKGLTIIPPGRRLSELIERESGEDFFNADLQFLTEVLPKVIVNNLSLAKKIEVTNRNHEFVVSIKQPFDEEIYKEIIQTTLIPYIGSPLGSAIACILAKVTRKPIIIEKVSLSNHRLLISYRIIGD